MARPGRFLTFVLATLGAPGATAVPADPPAAATSLLSPAPANPAPMELREDSLAFTTRDGILVRGVIVAPAAGRTRAPVAVLIHDWTRDRDTLAFVTDELVARGVACLVLDVRGHGRSGQRVDNTLYYYKVRPPSDMHLVVDDLRIALDLLRPRTDLDAERLALLGIGHGALIAAETAARFPATRALVLVDPAQPVADFQPDRDLGLFGRRPVLFVTSAAPASREWARALAEFGTGEREVWPGESFNSVHALLQPGMPALPLTAAWLAARLLPAGSPP